MVLDGSRQIMPFPKNMTTTRTVMSRRCAAPHTYNMFNYVGLGKMISLLCATTCIITNNSVFVSALLECNPTSDGDAFCAKMYRPGSQCVPNKGRVRSTDNADNNESDNGGGTCSNPFISGCLRNYLGEKEFSRVRVCNSDDVGGGALERGECVESEFDYEEIRILNQDWESAMFSAWIMQIFLSEVLGVPTTIETGNPDKPFSFYDPGMGFSYGSTSYDYGALRASLNNGGDCKQFQADRLKNGENYQACAHVIPEIWSGQKAEMAKHVKEGLIEPTSGSGGVGKLSWYIPYFTAKRDPILLSYFGLAAGNDTDKRRKIAETFLPPHTWIDYCEKFTHNNCTSPPYYDDEGRLIASDPPPDSKMAAKYFVAESYHGHFAPTDEQDCDSHPDTCTGHIGNVKCSWSTFAVSQAHHLGIPVKSYGPLGRGGYSYVDMMDIYSAANYTKSDILIYWWTPEVKVQQYHGTDAEFQRVLLPSPSEECIESRVTQEQRCSDQVADNLGGNGDCDSEAHTLQKLVVSNLYEISYPDDKAMQSPAYDGIKGVKLSDLTLEYLFRQWYRRNVDSNYDARDAVCAWAAENLSTLQRYVPQSFPRSIEVQQFYSAASYAATALACVALALLGIMFVYTWKKQKERVFMHAQPNFLFMLLVGSGLICIAAILYSTEPNKGNCIARPWFFVLGNTLQIVPLIIKVAAINKICQAAASMRRYSIRPPLLYRTTAAITFCVAVYLLIWTLVDPYSLQSSRELTDDINEDGGHIVQITYSCASGSSVWISISFGFQFLLLVSATVLAYQNQHVSFPFNESFFLAMVVYAHFLFTALLVGLWAISDDLEAYAVSVASSFILSCDALASLAIYFLPKVKEIIKPSTSDDDRTGSLRSSGTVQQIRRNAERQQQGIPSLLAVNGNQRSNISHSRVSEVTVSFVQPGAVTTATEPNTADNSELVAPNSTEYPERPTAFSRDSTVRVKNSALNFVEEKKSDNHIKGGGEETVDVSDPDSEEDRIQMQVIEKAVGVMNLESGAEKKIDETTTLKETGKTAKTTDVVNENLPGDSYDDFHAFLSSTSSRK